MRFDFQVKSGGIEPSMIPDDEKFFDDYGHPLQKHAPCSTEVID
jgi:hypothetical protein